ncbi:carbon-nitrogen hydrolase family protein [Rhodococcus sp. PAMC28707]|uniref:carbon-nitrogen hydrolase family protein n=1 Tax=unclassified Rhodococcus (in: high G+C Gram-positive bacteria) TaxID=192944 RepID=UPI00109E0B1D|nr:MULTISPECIES: carbon-nitrogen hydrolase family protein [unclassified Rhodococcus (in: high G+C Gram-positive bacteria)]QCB50440.1 carbon-nitrogen hydrolase family protein [Rhodococcus sp. PAMC28705]QCB57868.1 carbon-nitrogen hydrolase family protein [Rhodococcus sp. PAMC28707]
MTTEVRVSLFQGPELAGDVEANLAAISRAAIAAADAGASMLVTPEMSTTGYDVGRLVEERAEAADGPIFDAVVEIARSSGLVVVYGFPERSEEGIYDSVQVVGSDGAIVSRYRKTHLFGELDRGHFVPGDELVVQFHFGGLTCGLLTCYDVEFPEAVRAHADAGTEWLIVPTGLMHPFDMVATHVVPTRAYESQLFVTYVNRCGIEGDLQYCGLTCAIAPDGSELGRAGRGEALLTVDIDPGVRATSREINTHLGDRRHDLYPQDGMSGR